MRSTIGWWVATEEGMVSCIRLGTLTILLVTFCKVMSILDWWVASEKSMVPCVRLGTLTFFWLHSVEGGENHRLVSCIWWRFCALRKVRYIPCFWLHPVVGGENHGYVNFIWVRYSALHKFRYSPLAFSYNLERWRAPLIGELHLKKVWCPA